MLKLIFTILFFLISPMFSYADEKVSVQLLWKHQFEFAGYYMAKEKGFYKDAGLDVEIKELSFGTNISHDVENQKSTFGVAYPNIILDKSNGANIKILNAIFQSSPHVLIALDSSGIKNIKDFKTKKVMIEDDALKSAPLLSMLYSQKLSLKDIKVVKPSFDINDLINGKVDVFSAYSSNELYKLDNLGIKYRVFDPKDYGFDFYNDIIFTSSSFAKDNPLAVQRFQKATLLGWEYAFSNINETIKVIEEKYNTQFKSKNALQYEAGTLRRLAYKKDTPLGNLDQNKLKRIQDIYGLIGFVKNDIDFDQFIFDNKKIYLTKEEKDFIKNKILNVSVSKDCKPFSFQDKDGAPSGISAEYWNLIANQLGLKVKYTFSETFTDQLKLIENKKVDVIFSTAKTKDRIKYSLFTNEYLTFPVSIATLNNEDFIEDFNKVIGRKIAVGRNFTAHKLLEELYPKINFVFVESIEDGLRLVDEGEVFGFVDMKPSLNYNIKRFKFDNIKIAGNTGAIFKVSIMIRDDYPLLQSILDKAINSISNYEIDKIVKRYDRIEFEKVYDYGFIYFVLITLGLIFSFVVFRQYILNKANRNLQKLVDEKTKNLKVLNETLEEKIKFAVEENKTKDAMLYQQSKMASMGEMIGNIAHQWRQPLSVISTSVTGMSFKMEYDIPMDKHEIIDNLDRVNETVQFLSSTIDDFQNYLKPQEFELQFNAKDVVLKNLEMFGKSFEINDVKIIVNFEDVFLSSGKNELLQVVINILNNGKDALKEFVSENRLLFVSIYKDGDNGVISIKDNAGGIEDDILPYIFDAYFTTKHKSQGTGLGLYMSYQIITNRFNGNIVVSNDTYIYDNKSHKGANFKIILPLS